MWCENVNPTAKRNLVIALSFISCFCALGLFLAACDSSTSKGKCFLTPCMRGEGVADLWAVSTGDSFQAITTGMLAIFLPSATVLLFFKGKAEAKSRSLYIAMLLCALLSLQSAVIYGSNLHVVQELYAHEHTYLQAGAGACGKLSTPATCFANNQCVWATTVNEVVDDDQMLWKCQIKMTVSSHTETTLKAVTGFAAMCFVMNFFIAVLLRLWYATPDQGGQNQWLQQQPQQPYVPPQVIGNTGGGSFSMTNPQQQKAGDVGFDQL